MNKNKPDLAINGGDPVAKETVLIHLPYLDSEDMDAVKKAVESTFVSGDGPECRKFEEELATYIGAKHVFFVNSATSALDLAFRVKGFPKGAEVIVPDFTYTSTALGALYNDLKVKLVDVDPVTGLIDIDKMEAAINENTVALAPVDYAGCPPDMDRIEAIANKHGLWVVHDTAQSLGSELKGKNTGNFGDVSTFSFHGTKNMTTGEGGALVTDNDEIAEVVKVMREKGTDKYSFLTDNVTRGYYEYVNIGNSYVQSNILGALGRTQLKKLDVMNAERTAIAEYYMIELKDIPGLRLPFTDPAIKRNWHLFDLHVDIDDKYWIMDALRAEGIHANVHYTPLHRNRYYADLGSDKDFPGTMAFFGGLLRLPIYPSLTNEQRELVVKAVKKVMA
jgi:dTDP-4-amino-4,6-dideoxygalactose transaminase